MSERVALRVVLFIRLLLLNVPTVSAQRASLGGVLAGRVVGLANGLPVIGVALMIAGRSVETDFNGVAAMNSA
jgi:hypothetical protein